MLSKGESNSWFGGVGGVALGTEIVFFSKAAQNSLGVGGQRQADENKKRNMARAGSNLTQPFTHRLGTAVGTVTDRYLEMYIAQVGHIGTVHVPRT